VEERRASSTIWSNGWIPIEPTNNKEIAFTVRVTSMMRGKGVVLIGESM